MTTVLDIGLRNPMTTRGDIIAMGATAPSRVAKGAASDLVSYDADDVVTSTLSAILDAKIGSTRGMVAARGVSTWGSVALPTNGGQPALLGSDGTDIAAIGGKFSCRVYRGAAVSLTSGVAAKVSFDSESFDNGALHSTSVNPTRLTAPVAGRYVVCGSIGYDANATGIRQANLFVNGSLIIEGYFPNNGASSSSVIFVATVLDLAANDYVELEAYQNSGGALNQQGSALRTWCAMALLNGD